MCTKGQRLWRRREFHPHRWIVIKVVCWLWPTSPMASRDFVLFGGCLSRGIWQITARVCGHVFPEPQAMAIHPQKDRTIILPYWSLTQVTRFLLPQYIISVRVCYTTTGNAKKSPGTQQIGQVSLDGSSVSNMALNCFRKKSVTGHSPLSHTFHKNEVEQTDHAV